MPFFGNKDKKKAPRAKGIDIGIQMNALEVIRRYGQEVGVQLRKNQRSLMEMTDHRYARMPEGMNILQMHLLGNLYQMMDKDMDMFKELPPDIHPYLKLLKQVSILYMRPEMLNFGGEEVDMETEADKLRQKGFDKTTYTALLGEIAAKGKDDPKIQEGLAILQQAWIEKRALTNEELAFVFELLGAPVKEKAQFNNNALLNLFNVLQKNGLITDEDKKNFGKTAEQVQKDDDGAGGIGHEPGKMNIETIVMMIQPHMQIGQGTIASKNKVKEFPDLPDGHHKRPLLRATAPPSQKSVAPVTAKPKSEAVKSYNPQSATSKASTTSSGFFGEAPEDKMVREGRGHEMWQNVYYSGEVMRCMAAGADNHRNLPEHQTIQGSDHPYAAQLMTELANTVIITRPVVARGVGRDEVMSDDNQSLKSTVSAHPSSLKSTNDNVTLRSVREYSQMQSARTANPRSAATSANTMNDPEPNSEAGLVSFSQLAPDKATKERYQRLLALVRRDKEFMKDPEKKNAVDILDKAINSDGILPPEQMAKVMAAISKDSLVPAPAVEKVLQNLVKAGTLDQADVPKIVKETQPLLKNKKGIPMKELTGIVQKYANAGTNTAMPVTAKN